MWGASNHFWPGPFDYFGAQLVWVWHMIPCGQVCHFCSPSPPCGLEAILFLTCIHTHAQIHTHPHTLWHMFICVNNFISCFVCLFIINLASSLVDIRILFQVFSAHLCVNKYWYILASEVFVVILHIFLTFAGWKGPCWDLFLHCCSIAPHVVAGRNAASLRLFSYCFPDH